MPATLIAARARFGISLVALAVATLVGGLLLVPDAARAANATVSVGSPTNQFNANVSTINVGDKVTFTWAAGTHVVDLMDVSPDLTMDATHTSGTTDAFAKVGTYYYYCSIHATAALATEAHVLAKDAMVGKIVVAAAPAAATATTPPATATAPAVPTATPPAVPTAARPATAVAPAAPNTGTGPTSGGDHLGSLPLLAGIFLALVGGLGFAIKRR